MPIIAGSLFVRNAVKYDYCLEASVRSLSATCDKVVVIDAQSESDGTFALLEKLAEELKNVSVAYGYEWECERPGYPGKDRLVVLANKAKALCGPCDWHIMLQADEVLHESFGSAARSAIEMYPESTAFMCTRFNLYGDTSHYVSFTAKEKPCSDHVVRLAKPDLDAYGDAESVEGGDHLRGTYESALMIFHYGFVRSNLVEKALDMQSWFGCGQDKRLIELKEKGEKFDGRKMMDPSYLKVLPLAHPIYAKQWVEEHKNESA